MNMYFVISLIIAATASHAVVLNRGEGCVDNKPDVADDMTSPVCLHDCAGYAAMGACGSTWGTCIPDHSTTIIRDSCKESCGHADCAEEEEPDYCAIANCLDDAAYKKCPGKCAGNSGNCQVVTDGDYVPLDDDNVEPLLTVTQTRAFELSFDFKFDSLTPKPKNPKKSTNIVLVHMSGGGTSSVTPAAYLNNAKYISANMKLGWGKQCYHGKVKAAGDGGGTFYKELKTFGKLNSKHLNTWYSMKFSKTKKLTGGYHWEVRFGESDKTYNQWDNVVWEVTDLREEMEHGNVALYVGNDPWGQKLDGLLRNVKYCNLGN